MDWDKLRIFHSVAKAGSFTRAGSELHLSQSSISRQISALEQSLRTNLFHRHARGLFLTEQGQLLYRVAGNVFEELACAEDQILETQDNPEGKLRITTTVSFGSTWLTERIGEFVELYPKIDISIILSDASLDLNRREADIAIRMTPPQQLDLIQKRLMGFSHRIYGARSYLEAHGIPQRFEDLDCHKLIVFGDEAPLPAPDVNWILTLGRTRHNPRRPILRVNNQYGIYRAVRSGLGLASLPEFMVPTRIPNLEMVLPDARGPSHYAWFVYPEALRSARRVQLFRDFLVARCRDFEKTLASD